MRLVLSQPTGSADELQSRTADLLLSLMDADVYIKSIIGKYALIGGPGSSATAAVQTLVPILQNWAGSYLNGISYSGSTGKGTAIAGIAGVDLFISLKSDTPKTLGEIYTNLLNYRPLQGFAPKRQNVSVGVKVNGHQIDLVPGRK